MTRNSDLSRPAVLDGGTINAQPASRGANAIQAPNVISFPSGRDFLPDSRASGRELSIQDDDLDSGAVCVVAVIFSCIATAVGAGIYVGAVIFDFFKAS